MYVVIVTATVVFVLHKLPSQKSLPHHLIERLKIIYFHIFVIKWRLFILKNVLPVLTGISYDDMEIKNGEEASLKFLNITFLKNEKEPDKCEVEKIRKDLLDYCGLDTEGMIFILRELYKLSKDI
jgi:hypothetical protein